MCQLMDKFSTKYNKRFLWKFSANSHDKGVFDGIGIMSNQLFRVNQWAKRKGQDHFAGCKVFLSSCQQSNECY